jgi:hypothetical protein
MAAPGTERARPARRERAEEEEAAAASAAAGEAARLRLRVAELEAKYAELVLQREQEHERLSLGAKLALWQPLIKIAFSSTLTALILFIVAEQQGAQGPRAKVLFGMLSALGGASVFLAIPFVHWVGARIHKSGEYKLFQPFRGGVRFVVLQVSWTRLAHAPRVELTKHTRPSRGCFTASPR